MVEKSDKEIIIIEPNEGWRKVLVQLAKVSHSWVGVANNFEELEEMTGKHSDAEMVLPLYGDGYSRRVPLGEREVIRLVETATQAGIPEGRIAIYHYENPTDPLLKLTKAKFPNVQWFDIHESPELLVRHLKKK